MLVLFVVVYTFCLLGIHYCNIVHIMYQVLHYPFIYQLSCTTPCFFTDMFQVVAKTCSWLYMINKSCVWTVYIVLLLTAFAFSS